MNFMMQYMASRAIIGSKSYPKIYSKGVEISLVKTIDLVSSFKAILFYLFTVVVAILAPKFGIRVPPVK